MTGRDVHRAAVDLIERELARSGCDNSTALTAHIATVLAGHHIRFAEAHPAGPADWHTQPHATKPTDE